MLPTKLEAAKRRYLELRTEYYENGNTSATDAEYDALEDSIRAAEPKWRGLKGTGVKVGSKSAVALMVAMPSLDKIKADDSKSLDRWVRKTSASSGELHVSEKLDGSSIQGTYRNGKLSSLSTRGDGEIGKNISHFIPYVNLPKTIKTDRPVIVVRFEAVMKSELYLKKYTGQFDSDRALASAVFNRQDVHPAMKDLDLIALKIQMPVMGIAQSQQEAKQLGFQVARGKVVDASNCTAEKLSALLEKVRATSEYILDGLVLHSTDQRPEVIGPTDERPEYARAFKVNDEANALDTEIIDIVWKVSSFGLLVPKAIIKPIQFGGVTVKQAALHNPRWASDRGAGIGAKVKVLRSGDIIPKIVAVTKPAKLTLPDPKKVGAYEWDKTKTSLVLEDAGNNADAQVQTIARFFSKLDLDKVAGGLAEKLVAAGYTETSVLPRLTAVEFGELPGVKSSAANMALQMKRVLTGEFTIIKLMVASGCFDRGLGETRLDTLWAAEPGMFKPSAANDLQNVAEVVAGVKGCGPAFAAIYVKGLHEFWEWVKASGVSFKKPSVEKVVKGSLTGLTFCWTGYRSAEEEEFVKSLGGKVEGFKSSTSVLFYKPEGKSSSKVEKAGARAHTFASWKKQNV